MTDEQRALLIAMVRAYGDHHDKDYDLCPSNNRFVGGDIDGIVYHPPSIDHDQVDVSLPSGKVTSGDHKLIDRYLLDQLVPVLEPLLPLCELEYEGDLRFKRKEKGNA